MFYFSIFFFPIPFNYNQLLLERHFTPLHKGRGKQPQGLRGGGASIPPSHSPQGSH